jgi:hypothetical protein
LSAAFDCSESLSARLAKVPILFAAVIILRLRKILKLVALRPLKKRVATVVAFKIR